MDDGALQHLIRYVLFTNIVGHKSFVRKLVPDLEVLDEVASAGP